MIGDHTLAKLLHFRADGLFFGHDPQLDFGGASAGGLLQKLLIHITHLLSLDPSSPHQQPSEAHGNQRRVDSKSLHDSILQSFYALTLLLIPFAPLPNASTMYTDQGCRMGVPTIPSTGSPPVCQTSAGSKTR